MRFPLPHFADEAGRYYGRAISISGTPYTRGRESVRGLLPTPYFASGEELGTTKETSDRCRPLLRTACEKFARGRCISADLRITQELKGICEEKPLRERGVIILLAEPGWGLFDRIPVGAVASSGL